MKRFLTLMFAFLLMSSWSVSEAQKQPNKDIPLPEYYGLYLVNNGKLCGLDVETNPCSVKSVEVTVGRRAGVGQVLNGGPLSTSYSVKAIEANKGIRFLLYRENPSFYIGTLRLIPMVYIRNITVDTGWPNNVVRGEVENAWDSGDPSEIGGDLSKLNETIQPIPLLVKPLKADMVLGVPARELTPGLYRLSFGDQVIGNEPKLYFWLGNAREAEALKCVDATYEYYMIQSKSRFKPCAEASNGAANVSKTTNNPPAEPIKTGLTATNQVKIKARVGQTLAQIAAIYNVSVDELAKLNNITPSAELQPGQEIMIPAAAPGEVTNDSANAPKAAPSNPSTESIMAEIIAIEGLASEAALKGDKATVESLLDESYTYTNLGNRKTWDRTTFLSKIKHNKSIKSFSCKDHTLSFEGDVAVVTGICEYYIQNFLVSTNVKQQFTDRLKKKDGKWKFVSSEIFILPDKQPNR